jgi:hypothetical protein
MCKVSNKMKCPSRFVYLRHASNWPDCATQPRGRRLRSRWHILLITVLRRLLRILSTLNHNACAICQTSNTSRACHEIAYELPACLLYASYNANPIARSSFANLLVAKSLLTQYSPIPREKRRSSIKT